MIVAIRLLGARALRGRGPMPLAFLIAKQPRFSSTLTALSRDECISAFDTIKNDQVILKERPQAKRDSPKKVTIDFGMLSMYAEELNVVLEKAAFIGVTHIPIKRPFVEQKPLDAALLHFRGFERGDSICLYYQRTGFPLVPSPAASYIPPSERTLSHFETVMSGVSGLRVSRVHCPFFFKNVIAIDLKPAHVDLGEDSEDSKPESYRILVTAKSKGNRLLLTDNSDGLILLTSETFDEKSGIKDGVGAMYRVDKSKKRTPDPTESYEGFLSQFEGKQHMSLVKAMIMTYEGLDPGRITYLAGKAGVDSSLHVSKIENLPDFYNTFIRWLRSPVESSEHLQFYMPTAEGDKPESLVADEESPPKDDLNANSDATSMKTVSRYIFHHWGDNGPVYQHHRIAEKSRVLIDETLERLEKVRSQCIGDEQQVERLMKVDERISNIRDYERSLGINMTWKSPETFDLVKTIYQQVWELGDLTGYRKKLAKTPYSSPLSKTDDEEGRNVPHFRVKKENPYKGILVIKTHPQNPETALIIVGKNAKQNERVTHEIAQKGDIWLHTRDCPGSHVLLRRSLGSAEALQIAADIAAYYSKAKKLESAPVIKTSIENVKKCPDAQIGAVLVSNFETIQGRPANGGEYVKAHRISLN
ncbi:hypothetical protein BgAZ_209310 [Babesia gibsoni]|uniref:NFACT RNA-binding domain-containing protein n=1 Tax=Babesia gibsoni TaxID=33632 RepID=A0AAD8UQZ5_BABGI|nr:hypothetical protein BgAZ_209310 [Babesia gibsoni]